MRLAWFRDVPLDAAAPLDETAPVVRELGHTHEVNIFTATTAHDFVWMQARRPYDLSVYEVPQAPWHSWMHAYVQHYPGLALTPGERPRGWGRREDHATAISSQLKESVSVGVIDGDPTMVNAAAARARDLGAPVDLMSGEPFTAVQQADIVLALAWSSAGESLAPALATMAAGKPLVVYELEATATWPALDPQTWSLRGPAATGPPAVVSIDVRDREHSLMLALRRLSDDASLRAELGAAARAWWERHGTVQHAAAAWERLFTHAIAEPKPAASRVDGSARARGVLAQLGVSVDIL